MSVFSRLPGPEAGLASWMPRGHGATGLRLTLYPEAGRGARIWFPLAVRAARVVDAHRPRRRPSLAEQGQDRWGLGPQPPHSGQPAASGAPRR